jgi:hypothetical protein
VKFPLLMQQQVNKRYGWLQCHKRCSRLVESLLDGAHVAGKGNNVVNVEGDGLMEMYPEEDGQSLIELYATKTR